MIKETAIRIEEEKLEKLKTIAEKENRSLNKQMVHFLEDSIERYLE